LAELRPGMPSGKGRREICASNLCKNQGLGCNVDMAAKGAAPSRAGT
jgi:hypothetical protein